jgi:hypothetical protein
MERGIELYRRERHASQAFLYAGHDPGACCRYQLSLVRWLLGSPDTAVALARDALRLCDELKQAQTTSATLWFTVALQLLRGEREAAAANAARLGALAEAHGFAHWTDIVVVASPATGGAPADRATLAQMHERLKLLRTAVWRRVVCLCLLAGQCLDAGCPEEGRRVLASISDDQRLAILAPEIQRLEGGLPMTPSAPSVPRSTSPAAARRSRSSCARRRASHGCGDSKADAKRRARCSRRSTARSPRGLTRRI